MLKLKDWPPRTAFRSKMPQLHADLMGSLPFQQYAHVDGVLNLARYLPADALAPDLGPKVRRGRCSRVQHEQPRAGTGSSRHASSRTLCFSTLCKPEAQPARTRPPPAAPPSLSYTMRTAGGGSGALATT